MHASRIKNDARADGPECTRRSCIGWVEDNNLHESWTATVAECSKQTNSRASGKTLTMYCCIPSNAKVHRRTMNDDSVALVDDRIPASPRDLIAWSCVPISNKQVLRYFERAKRIKKQGSSQLQRCAIGSRAPRKFGP